MIIEIAIILTCMAIIWWCGYNVGFDDGYKQGEEDFY